MKRLPLSLTLLLALAPAPASAKTIGVTISRIDAFYSVLAEGIRNSGKEKGADTKIVDAQGDSATQVQMVKDFIAAKVDAIMVAAVDSDSGVEMSRLAAAAGIPLVYVNAMPANVDELPKSEAFVGSDERESGVMQTREVCRRLGGHGEVAVIMGELVNYAARQRTQDIHDVIDSSDCKGLKVVEQQSANWSRTQAEQQVKEWIGAGVRFDAVIANNDEMALGAVRALKDAGSPRKKVVVAGIDGTRAAVAAVQAGDLEASVLQNAGVQGARAVDAALTLSSNGEVPSKIFVPFELITAENAARYASKN